MLRDKARVSSVLASGIGGGDGGGLAGLRQPSVRYRRWVDRAVSICKAAEKKAGLVDIGGIPMDRAVRARSANTFKTCSQGEPTDGVDKAAEKRLRELAAE